MSALVFVVAGWAFMHVAYEMDDDGSTALGGIFWIGGVLLVIFGIVVAAARLGDDQ